MLHAAVIGLGAMGANHARVYSALDNVKLVACSDLNKNTKQIADQYNANFYIDYKKMLLKECPDIVSVCVPTTLHKKISLYAIKKGINVLVEKPIADSVKNAQAIINSAKKYKLKLMIGHIERFNPVIQALKKYLQKTKQKIFSINIERVGPFPPRIKDVGVVLDLGTHDVDLSTFLTNSKVKSVFCLTNSYNSKLEDSAHITLELEKNISCSITTNWLTPYKQRKIEVITNKSVLQGDLIIQELKEFKKFPAEKKPKSIKVIKVEPLKLELSSFINSVKQNRTPEITGEEALQTLKIAQLCLKSAARKKIITVK